MKNITLFEVLETQDYSPKHAQNLCDQVLNDTFEAEKDPISAIIINSFVGNDYTDFDSMVTDLNYAIHSLTKARNIIEKQAL